jgi:hypothetical protein
MTRPLSLALLLLALSGCSRPKPDYSWARVPCPKNASCSIWITWWTDNKVGDCLYDPHRPEGSEYAARVVAVNPHDGHQIATLSFDGKCK